MFSSKKSLEKLFDQQIEQLKRASELVYLFHTLWALEQMKDVVVERVLSWSEPLERGVIPFVPVVVPQTRSHADFVSTVRSSSGLPFRKGKWGSSVMPEESVRNVVPIPSTSTYYLLGVKLWDLYEGGVYHVFNGDGSFQNPERCCTTAEIIAIGIHGKLPNHEIIHALGSECSRDADGVYVPALDMNFEKKGPRLYAHHIARTFFQGLPGSVPHCRERISL